MANELKGLSEKKAELVAEADSLIAATKDERRAFTEEENTRFTAIEAEIKAINNTMDAEKRAVQLALQPPDEESVDDVKAKETESAKAEERAFTNYVYSRCGRAVPEIRADEQNLTMGNNGAIIPVTVIPKTESFDISETISTSNLL
ncbi:MAG: phage major capsid protein [Oscillospiraceae bacterium]|nr:phage major capsid protein [Oscillospiraceae bacterium]